MIHPYDGDISIMCLLVAIICEYENPACIAISMLPLFANGIYLNSLNMYL